MLQIAGRVTLEQVTAINRVTTVAEVKRCWHKSDSAVRQAIDDGRLAARRAGRVYLISMASVVRLWGKPTDEPDYAWMIGVEDDQIR